MIRHGSKSAMEDTRGMEIRSYELIKIGFPLRLLNLFVECYGSEIQMSFII